MFEDIIARLKVEDQASGPLGKIAKSAGNFTQKITGFGAELKAMAGIGAGVGAAFAFQEALHSTNEYLEKVKEVHELTGMAADQTDFLFSSARKAGVAYADMEQIAFKLSRRGAAMESAVMGSNDAAKTLNTRFRRLGIDVTQGPVKSLEAMSKAVAAGKLDADDLMARFGIPKRAANDFHSFMKDMGEVKPGTKITEFIRQFEQAKKAGQLISQQDMANFQRMEGLQHQMNDGFTRIKVAIGKEVLPLIIDMLERFDKALPNWIEKARQFGQLLRDHMHEAIAAAKLMGKILIANAAVSKLTGGQHDLPGLIKMGPALTNGLVQAISKALPRLGGAGAGVGIGVMSQFGGGLSKILGLSGGFATTMGTLAGSFTVLLPVVAGVAAVIGIAVAAFKGFQNNVNGVRDRIMAVWDEFSAKLDIIKDAFTPIISGIQAMFGGEGALTRFFQGLASGAFLYIFKAFDGVVEGIVYIGYLLGEYNTMWDQFWGRLKMGLKNNLADPFMAVLKGIGTVIERLLDKDLSGAWSAMKGTWSAFKEVKSPAEVVGGAAVKALTSGAQRAYDRMAADISRRAAQNRVERLMKRDSQTAQEKQPPKVEMNFNNARFDITQNFAEGFDPDRIAVAFASDLANLGDLRTASGLTPAFAGR